MSVDSVWANVAFAEKLRVSFNILSDPAHARATCALLREVK